MEVAHGKATSKRVATKASSLLRSKRTTSKTKSVAASALTQKHKGKGSKKR
jgi:hypothetical protein